MILADLIWYFTYLYIRIYLNPDNKEITDKHKRDAYYGSLATCASFILGYYGKYFIDNISYLQ